VPTALLQAALFVRVRDVPLDRPGQLADQRQRSQRHQGHCPHGTHPADALDQLLQNGGKNELAERTTGIDHAGSGATGLQRQALGSRADQHRKAARPRADGDIRPNETINPKPVPMNGVMADPSASNTRPPIKHGTRAVAICYCTGHRLNGAPGELPDRQRQTDAGNAQPGCCPDWRDEQPERLTGAHGDHQDAGGGQRNNQNVGAIQGAQHVFS
jgi:hypothetical protein